MAAQQSNLTLHAFSPFLEETEGCFKWSSLPFTCGQSGCTNVPERECIYFCFTYTVS